MGANIIRAAELVTAGGPTAAVGQAAAEGNEAATPAFGPPCRRQAQPCVFARRHGASTRAGQRKQGQAPAGTCPWLEQTNRPPGARGGGWARRPTPCWAGVTGAR